MIQLVLNDITIIEIWITNEKTRNWSTPLRLIDNGSTSWCTCIYDFPMVVFLHPSMLQYLKQTFMQYDRPLSKKYKTCSVFLLFDNERKFKNDRRELRGSFCLLWLQTDKIRACLSKFLWYFFNTRSLMFYLKKSFSTFRFISKKIEGI